MPGAAVIDPPRSREFNLSHGPEGVRETLYLMKRIVRDSKKVPAVMIAARQALAGVPPKHWKAEADALFRFVQRTVRYTMDPSDVEGLITPERLMQDVHAGDCDDMAMLLAALLESVNHPTRFVAVGFDDDPPGELTHVFVQTKIGGDNAYNGGWYSLDATEPNPPGWEPPNVARCFVVNN